MDFPEDVALSEEFDDRQGGWTGDPGEPVWRDRLELVFTQSGTGQVTVGWDLGLCPDCAVPVENIAAWFSQEPEFVVDGDRFCPWPVFEWNELGCGHVFRSVRMQKAVPTVYVR